MAEAGGGGTVAGPPVPPAVRVQGGGGDWGARSLGFGTPRARGPTVSKVCKA